MLQARFVRTYEDLVAGVVPNSLYPGRHCAGHNHVEQLSRWHAGMRVTPKTGRAAIGTLSRRTERLSRALCPLLELNAFPMPLFRTRTGNAYQNARWIGLLSQANPTESEPTCDACS